MTTNATTPQNLRRILSGEASGFFAGLFPGNGKVDPLPANTTVREPKHRAEVLSPYSFNPLTAVTAEDLQTWADRRRFGRGHEDEAAEDF